ncbi:hypothetical protein CTheo_5000 [Ceratobasidium theobromae]|uniref:Uncharacterized protein n=1 Tax=Ceratobasidium theobromae TaxID=1582974 RepID=A0A5N5QJD4_9AGAM|nr:hypothetical protein CTheo_5000 [Ceratobasidium theobromae]
MEVKIAPKCLLSSLRARKKFISSSLASSTALIERASRPGGVGEKTRLCFMDFHDEWRHKDCPVMKWHADQRSSSTRFRSIRHLQDDNPPFFHEYLLLELEDGSICRVERTGEGSRVDAVRFIGCPANDTIQWFTTRNYEIYTRDKPSKLIARVNFYHDFDILDVLAICYAVHAQRRTRAYTLQRFNCYFLCNTILLVLTRHLAEWENIITLDTWKSALCRTFDQLHDTPYDSPESPLIFRVCSTLDPGSRNPAEFLFNALRHRLDADSAYKSVHEAVADTLWGATSNEIINQALTDHVDVALAIALEAGGACATALKSATFGTKSVLQREVETFDSVKAMVEKKALRVIRGELALYDKTLEELHQMETMERPISVGRVLAISMAAQILGALFPLQLALSSNELAEWGFKGKRCFAWPLVQILLPIHRHAAGKPPRTPGIAVEDMVSFEISSLTEKLAMQINYGMATQTLDKVLLALTKKGILTPSNVMVALHVVLSKKLWDAWLKISIQKLLKISLLEQVPGKQILVTIPSQIDKTAHREIRSIFQFQDYVQQRIEDHGRRVESYGLASARLVSQDIQGAITSVWRLVPTGVGDSRPEE